MGAPAKMHIIYKLTMLPFCSPENIPKHVMNITKSVPKTYIRLKRRIPFTLSERYYLITGFFVSGCHGNGIVNLAMFVGELTAT